MSLLDRHLTRESVRLCKACSLSSSCRSPIPFDGPSPTNIVVIGEAPGRVEDEQGVPFVGPSGSLARTWVDAIGVNATYLNVVSCFPNRTPTSDEVAACRTNLIAQLTVIRPRFMLLFGGIAVSAFIPNMRIGKVAGLWWQPADSVLAEVWGMATWHPAAVLRNRELEHNVMVDLSVFRDVVVDGLEPWISQYCVECGSSEGVEWTANRIAYCRKHREWREGVAGKGRTSSPAKSTPKPQTHRRSRSQTKMNL